MLSFNRLSLLLEKKNLYYKLPVANSLQLYDFYACEFLNSHLDKTTIGSSDFKGGSYMEVDSPTLRLGVSNDVWIAFKEVKDTLLPHLKEHLLNMAFFAIAAEIRYAFEQSVLNYVNYYPKMRYFVDSYHQYGSWEVRAELNALMNKMYDDDTRDLNHLRTSGVAKCLKIMLKNDWTLTDIVQICRDLYETNGWEDGYGGPAWANVCEGWLMLNKARTEQQLFTYIDHMYDLQHNNGTIFNKVAAFKEYDMYENVNNFNWISEALNFKRDLKSPLEYVNKISRSFKPIFTRLLKSLGYEGSQNKEAEQLKIDAMFDIFDSEEYKKVDTEINDNISKLTNMQWIPEQQQLEIFGKNMVTPYTSICLPFLGYPEASKTISWYGLPQNILKFFTNQNSTSLTVSEFFNIIKNITNDPSYTGKSYDEIYTNYLDYTKKAEKIFDDLKISISKKIDFLKDLPRLKNIVYNKNGTISKRSYTNCITTMQMIQNIRKHNILSILKFGNF